MSKEQSRVQTLTQLAMTVAALIAGGYVIFIVSSFFPLPGIKYLLMSPYLSLVIAIVMRNIHTKVAILKINTVFALIMSMINIYMGLAIFLTGFCTQIVATLLVSFKYVVQLSAASYSAFTVGSALLVSRVVIGGPIFKLISWQWIVLATLISFILGLLGGILGNQMAFKVKKALSSK